MPEIQTKSTLPASHGQPRTTRDLTAAKRRLIQVMTESQYGRIENLLVRAGQPLLDPGVRIVRVALLGGESSGTTVHGDQFELKKAVCDLLDELERLDNGMVVRLEFKRGLPCLLETAAAVIDDGPIAPAAPERREG
jgi:hypothetical protein